MSRDIWNSFLSMLRKHERRRKTNTTIVSERLENRALLTVMAMTARDQLSLELINRARANPAAEALRQGKDLNADLDPGTITTAAKQPLAPHQILYTIAGEHSQDMLDDDFFSHTNTEGKGPDDRAADAEYGHSIGENLAFVGTTGTLDQLASVTQMHNDLYDSQLHRPNIFDPDYSEIGVSNKFGEYKPGSTGYDSAFVTQNYGKPNTYITGVIYTDSDANGMYSVGEGAVGGTITILSNETETAVAVNNVGGYAATVANDSSYIVLYSDGSQTWIVEDVNVGSENVKVDFEFNTANLEVDIDFSFSAESVAENGGTATGTVTRGGSTTDPYVVTLSAADPTAISVPTSVTIPAGQASTTFTATAIDNATLTGTRSTMVYVDAVHAVQDESSLNILDVEEAVTLNGTSGNDSFKFESPSAGNYKVTLNGQAYDFQGTSPNVTLNGLAGTDTLELDGTSNNDIARLYPGRGILTNSGVYNVVGETMETIRVKLAAGSADQAYFYDAAGVSDTIVLKETQAWYSAGGNYNVVEGFEQVYASSNGDSGDAVQIYDSSGNDAVIAAPTTTRLTTAAGTILQAASFPSVSVFSTAGGTDTGTISDSSGNDTYNAYPTYGQLVSSVSTVTLTGLKQIAATASAGGNDTARFYDSAADDTFVAKPTTAAIYSGTTYRHDATSFDTVIGYATAGGTDTAYFHDTSGDDTFIGRPTAAYMGSPSSSYYNYASAFEQVVAQSSGGNDTAHLYDSAGNETYVGTPTYSYMRGASFYNLITNYKTVAAYAAAGGTDSAQFYDSAGDEILVTRPDYTYMRGTTSSQFYNYAAYFDSAYAYATAGGNDSVQFYDSAGNDYYITKDTYAYMQGTNFYNFARGFDSTVAYATLGGTDEAQMYDSSGNDTLQASGPWASLTDGSTYSHRAQGFDTVRGFSTKGGTDNVEELSALDFVFSTSGGWL